MFCLSERTSVNKITRNKKEFGWCINETEIVTSSFLQKLHSADFSSSPVSKEGKNCYLTRESTFSSKSKEDKSQSANKEESEIMELNVNVDFDKSGDKEENYIENGFTKSLGFSYTPERLVKSKEYKILSPDFQSACIHSTKFRQKKLSELIDPNKIGGIYLQKLLCPSLTEIKVSCNFKHKNYSVSNEIKDASNVISDFQKLKRFSKEKRNHKFSSSEEEDTSGIQSTGWSLDTSSDPSKALLRLEYRKSSFNEEDLEIDSDNSTILLDHSENLSELHFKVKKLRTVNQNIQKDIGTLKEDFQSEEWRINDLLEESNKFRREIQEMKYLDDLLNFLRDELERISQKTWPFISGHVDPYTEEINLVI